MSQLAEVYLDLIVNKRDPRTDGWFLVNNPVPLLLIIGAYNYFCMSAGPRFMRDRKPFNVRPIMIVYNLFQICICIYIVNEGLQGGWLGGYNIFCQHVEDISRPNALRMARAVHTYYMIKLTDLLDTVFFVLRKKDQQVTFLHVYHHMLMPVVAWIGVRFYPGGHVTLLGLINSFIHIFMYTYYLLTSLGPGMQKYLWWKKYLTIAQIVQFFIISVHNGQLLFTGCTTVPKSVICLLLLNTTAFVYLFSTFYIEAYIRKPKREAMRKQKESSLSTTSGKSSNGVEAQCNNHHRENKNKAE